MYEINYKLSDHIANKYGKLFKVNGCYENVFNMITKIKDLLNEKTKVLFCFAYNGTFLFRHTFCLYESEIIEPLQGIRKTLNLSGVIPISLLTVKDYFKLICKDKRYDLVPSLLKKEIQAINNNKALFSKLNLIDLNYIVSNLAKSSAEYFSIYQNVRAGKGIIKEEYMKTFTKNEAGVCPLCFTNEIDYGAIEVIDDGIKYPWSCPTCGATGEEHYNISFITHLRVASKDNEEYQLSENGEYCVECKNSFATEDYCFKCGKCLGCCENNCCAESNEDEYDEEDFDND